MKYLISFSIIYGNLIMLFELFVILSNRAGTITYFNLIGAFILFSAGIIMMENSADKRRKAK